jgi:beta-mannanase
MVVKVDGRTVASPTVRATRWTYYNANISRPSGAHRVSISYVNDVNSRRCSRDLHLDKLVITPVPAPASAPGSIALGAQPEGAPWDPAKIDQFTNKVGTSPKIVMWYESWSDTGFSAARMEAVTSRGGMPMMTWEPWNFRLGRDQSAYALRTIVRGDHDAYVRQWARDARAWGKPLYLRFAHEMNGNWYPWSPGVNGNTAAEYVAAWRHIHSIFQQEGATNVRWVWSPNVATGSSTPFAEVYPGDAYVDWVALDGYNWGTTQSWSNWQSLASVFGPSYDALVKMTNKPMMIAETASAEAGGDKAAWIRQGLLSDLPTRFPRVRAVIWFDLNKETDWRVNSSPTALAAYKEVATSPTYQGRLP